jgi:hypothetical protein
MSDIARENFLIWTPYGTFVVLGFLAGVLGTRVPRVPTIAFAAAILGYVTLITVTGAWFAACTDCESRYVESTRQFELIMAIVWGAVLTAGIIIFTSLGVGISTFARWLSSRQA